MKASCLYTCSSISLKMGPTTFKLITPRVDSASVLVGWIVLIFHEGTASEVAVGLVWIPHACNAIPLDLELFTPPVGIFSVGEPTLYTHICIAGNGNKFPADLPSNKLSEFSEKYCIRRRRFPKKPLQHPGLSSTWINRVRYKRGRPLNIAT